MPLINNINFSIKDIKVIYEDQQYNIINIDFNINIEGNVFVFRNMKINRATYIGNEYKTIIYIIKKLYRNMIKSIRIYKGNYFEGFPKATIQEYYNSIAAYQCVKYIISNYNISCINCYFNKVLD